jgi:dipeptidyl aminopeptidase/acylaminoacyl peptidase
VNLVEADSRTAWQPEGGALTLLEKDLATGKTVAERVDPATGTSRELWRRLGRLRGTSAAAPAEGSLVGVYEDPETPPDVYRFDRALGSPQRISAVEPAFDAVRGVDVRVLETRVPAPGSSSEAEIRPVETAILLPAGTEPGARLPAVVVIYPGEPISSSASHFAGGDPTTLPNLLFTSRGYAVVLPDLPLGPEGEPGEPVRQMVDALLPQLRHAADAGWIDFGRLGLMGQSYGGYGTAAIVSRTSLFRAAVAISGLYDLPGMWGRPDSYGGHFYRQWTEGGQGHMGGPPWAELPRYLANSPYYQVEHIHTPLLLVHGTKDDAVDESRKLFTALERLGRTAQYAEYEGEGHVVWGWKLPDATDAARRVTEFFERYLGEP